MKIEKALFAPGKSAFYFDDQDAIKRGARRDGFVYEGEPVTAGFRRVRQAGESISVVLVLQDGSFAEGDCAACQYSGAGGRAPLFLAEEYIPFLEERVKPLLEGRELGMFREMSEWMDGLEVDGRRLHSGLRYGLSQALLEARATVDGRLKVEVICDEYDLPVVARRLPIFGQTGDHRYEGVDKMVLKRADALPHALINNVDEKLGKDGRRLKKYVEWTARRIKELRINDGYRPDLHIDVYGTVGLVFDNDVEDIVDYLCELERSAGEFELYIEGLLDMGSREKQIDYLGRIRRRLRHRGCGVKLVADEWCGTPEAVRQFADAGCCDMIQTKTPDLGGIHNSIEAILYCRDAGLETYLGGTCNETDVSARCCVHVGLAVRPERMLAKPGMGFDEGFMIVNNEMSRVLSILQNRQHTY